MHTLLCVHLSSGKISFKETEFWNTKDSTEFQDLEGKVHPIIRIQSLFTLFSPLKVSVRFCRQPLEVSRGILTSVLASEVRFSQTAYINWFILTSNYFHFYNLPCKAYLLFLLEVSKMSHMGHLVIVRLNLTRDLCPESLSSLSLDISWPPDTNLIKATDHDLMYKTIFQDPNMAISEIIIFDFSQTASLGYMPHVISNIMAPETTPEKLQCCQKV